MKIIIGLGNPGEKYKKTRHNVGFELLDILAEKLGLDWQEDKKRNASIAKDNNYILIKPQSYMNLSGVPTRAVLDYYRILPKNYKLFSVKDSDLSKFLTVIHDDLDIDFGQFKKSTNSRSAGHKGVGSIINHIKTKNFNRYRIGIRNKDMEYIPREKFVLQKFKSEDLVSLEKVFSAIIKDILK